jgi:hypothetical protein
VRGLSDIFVIFSEFWRSGIGRQIYIFQESQLRQLSKITV